MVAETVAVAVGARVAVSVGESVGAVVSVGAFVGAVVGARVGALVAMTADCVGTTACVGALACVAGGGGVTAAPPHATSAYALTSNSTPIKKRFMTASSKSARHVHDARSIGHFV